MIKYDKNTDYGAPILMDNRDLRSKVPAIDAHFEAGRLEAEKFPKENGVIRDPEWVEFCACPVCGKQQTRQLFVKYGFIHAECPRCSHIFVQNRLREEALLKLYADSEADRLSRQRQTTPVISEYWTRVYGKYLAYLDGMGIRNRRLMDVGCGAGQFLKFCSQNTDYELHASDFCEDSYDFVTAITGEERYYYRQKLEDIDFKDARFGVMTFWGVLEHVANPAQVLAKAASLLDDGGAILLLLPNPNSRARQILGVRTPTLNPREHIQFFTQESLEYLYSRHGLRLQGLFQELPVIDLMYDHVDYGPELVADILKREESYYLIYILTR